MSVFNKLAISIFFFTLFYFNFRIETEGQYLQLSKSFLNGELYFPKDFRTIDSVLFNGHYYWPLGPFPAILLLPAAFISDKFNFNFSEGYLLFFINFAVFLLCYKIALLYKYSKNDSLTLAFAYLFASVVHVVALNPSSWFFEQMVAVCLVLLAIYMFLKGKHIKYSGLPLSLAIATRGTSLLGIIFYLKGFFSNSTHGMRFKIKNLFYFLVPIFIVLLLLLLYNYLRFNNPFETGYILANNSLRTEQEIAHHTKQAMFHIKYIPANIYFYFINLPNPIFTAKDTILNDAVYIFKFPFFKHSYPAISFFVVSPIFLLTFKNKMRNTITRNAAITSLLILMVLLSFRWSGWYQIGPRYTLDLLPYLYLVLLDSIENRSLSLHHKTIIILSALFNLMLVFGSSKNAG